MMVRASLRRLMMGGVGALAVAFAAPVLARPTATFPMAPAPAITRALVGGSVVDVETGKVIPDGVVLIRGDRIVAVGPAQSVTIPPDAQRLSMAGKWLIPGLINCHVHLGLVLPGAAGAALADETDTEMALRMAANARRALYTGVTTVRLTGEKHGVDFAVKRAINAGHVPGPRIETAGEIIVPTGGHGMLEVNGPDGFAQAVREQVKLGASWIKIAISGGIADTHGDIAAAPMTDAEMAMVSDVSRRLGVQIAAHNGSPIAAAQAMKYGVNSFEHGYFLTDQTLAEMKAKNVWLVPTIVVSQSASQEFFARIGSPQWYLDRVKSVGKAHWAMLQSAIRLGVPIALGTDEMPYEPNEGTTATVREAELYVEAGMSPLQALRSGTIEAARMLRMTGDVGSLQPGRYADVVALDANPLVDVHALRTVGFVMKGGRVVRSDNPAQKVEP